MRPSRGSITSLASVAKRLVPRHRNSGNGGNSGDGTRHQSARTDLAPWRRLPIVPMPAQERRLGYPIGACTGRGQAYKDGGDDATDLISLQHSFPLTSCLVFSHPFCAMYTTAWPFPPSMMRYGPSSSFPGKFFYSGCASCCYSPAVLALLSHRHAHSRPPRNSSRRLSNVLWDQSM